MNTETIEDPSSQIPSIQTPWLLIGGVTAGVAIVIVTCVTVIIVVCCLKTKKERKYVHSSKHDRFYDYPYKATVQTDNDASEAEINMPIKRNEAYSLKTRKSMPFEADESIYEKLHHK